MGLEPTIFELEVQHASPLRHGGFRSVERNIFCPHLSKTPLLFFILSNFDLKTLQKLIALFHCCVWSLQLFRKKLETVFFSRKLHYFIEFGFFAPFLPFCGDAVASWLVRLTPSGRGWSPGRRHRVLFLGKTPYSLTMPFSITGKYMGTDKLNAEGNSAMGSHATLLRLVGCCWLKFHHFQTWADNTQHVATHRNTVANADNMLRPTMLRYVALTCYDRLAGA